MRQQEQDGSKILYFAALLLLLFDEVLLDNCGSWGITHNVSRNTAVPLLDQAWSGMERVFLHHSLTLASAFCLLAAVTVGEATVNKPHDVSLAVTNFFSSLRIGRVLTVWFGSPHPTGIAANVYGNKDVPPKCNEVK